MIWTTATGVATQVVTPVSSDRRDPRLGALISEYGLLGGLLQRLESWREYPPHGPVSISTASRNDGSTLEGHLPNS